MGVEIWKPVVGYEGFYEVSNTGKVRSVPHRVKSRFKTRLVGGRELKLQTDKDGYQKVCLCKENKKSTFFVHRLVATSFLENPNMYPVINHKDEDKKNNDVSNLEYCTVQYNTVYKDAHIRRQESRRIPIIAIKDDEVIHFESIKGAARKLGVAHGNICSCLRGRYGHKTIKGYRFEYA